MTPKSLLRNKRCTSNMEDFTKQNTFHRVLNDHADFKKYGLIQLHQDKKIKKVIMCSGKIYFDLLEAREKSKNDEIVFIRVEQLYPFPVKHLGRELQKYKNAEFIWCQEEPMNMGAWNTVKYYIERTLEIVKIKGEKVKYVGRNAAASPATGNLNKHLAEQKEILEKVVGRIN